MQDIIEFALKMEKDGENFYRDLAAKTNNKGLNRILTMLADEEVKHYNTIQLIAKGSYDMTEADVIVDAANVFTEMKEKGDNFDSIDDQKELYAQARDLEKKSQDLYQDKADGTDNPAQKKLFETLAREERKHYLLLDGILDFISRPQQWIDDAEWSNIQKDV